MKQSKHSMHSSGSEWVQHMEKSFWKHLRFIVFLLLGWESHSCCFESLCVCLWALCKCEEEIRPGWRPLSGACCCSDLMLVRRQRVNPLCFHCFRLQEYYSFIFWKKLTCILMKSCFLKGFPCTSCWTIVKCKVQISGTDDIWLLLCDVSLYCW